MLCRLIVTTIVLNTAVAAAVAQNPLHVRNPKNWDAGGRQPIVMPADIKGTIEGVSHGGAIVLDAEGHGWNVSMQGANINVTGTAKPDYLQSGMTVELTATVDAQGKVKEKVGELKVLAPADKSLGLFPTETATEEKPADAKASKSAKRSTASKGGKGAIAAGTYRVVGKLVVGPAGKLTAKAGRHQLVFELNDQAKIDVELADLSMVAKGDKIEAKGFKTAGRGNLGMVKANEVKIELAEPLAGTKKKGAAAKPEPKRPVKRAKTEDGQQ